jgi:DNA invertase Pin-like site-specific DNA recombinase
MSTATATPTTTRRKAEADQRLVVSYERISRFRVTRHELVDAPVSRGVDRQAADAIKAADAMGLGEIAEHFTDNDRSASQYATKERERWLAMLELVASGRVSHVLFWLLDRAARTTEASDAMLAACRQGGAVIVQTATRRTYDPRNPTDVFTIKLDALLAEYEVARASQRQRRAKEEAANMGVSHGGRRRFGYEPGMTRVRESEAELIRALATRLLAGETLHSAAKWLNTEGVPTPSFDGTCNVKACRDQVVRALGPQRKGAGPVYVHADPARDLDHAALVTEWKGPNLRTMILRPHLAALRVHGKEADGSPKVIGAAAWPPILDRADHDSLKHLLADPKRRTSTSNARVYLLAGLARCAHCGEVLRGKPRGKGDQRRVYTCATNRHVHRAADDVDALVEQRIIARLEQTDASGVLVDNTAADLVTALTERLEVLKAERTAQALALPGTGLDADSIAEVMNGYATRIQAIADDLEAAREGARRPEIALDGMTGSSAAQAWAEASLGRKRAVLAFLASSITLRGADHGRRRLIQASDVQLEFRRLAV